MKQRWILLALLWPLASVTGLWAGNVPGDLATPVISEFMASNGSRPPLAVGDILDADGDSSDWIELYNPAPESFDLGGWYLTDDPNEPAKWRFPSPAILSPDGFLLVFASGKDRTQGQLHTNFKLDGEGGYLALVLSDGRTVIHEYAPSYPSQLTDVSYGLVQYRAQFVVPQSTASYHVPNALDEGRNWTAADFDDDTWDAAPANLSLAPAAGTVPGARTKGALRDDMLGKSTSVWMRIEFDAVEMANFDTLLLCMQYEDGFVAYLNGVEVARDNFAGAPRWDSAAGGDRADELMSQPVVFDLSVYRSLLRAGHNVLAIQGLNDNRTNTVFLIAPELVAGSTAQDPQYLAVPTPGYANVSGPMGVVAGPRFSHEHGLYDGPFTLTLSCDTPGTVIRYTTDGRPPVDTSRQVYTAPLIIAKTTCIRAAAFKPGCRPSRVETQTFIFANDVQRQPSNPSGFPAAWGVTLADYEMDPEIANSLVRQQLTQALKSLPTMSIVMDVEDLFGAKGIYTNWGSSGDAWERPGSVELIQPDGSEGFQVNCGIRIYGGVGRREAKKSFRLQFTRTYGPTELHYPLFGEGVADRFDQLVLRANFNDAYTWGGNRSQYIRDEFVRQLQLALGQPSPHGTFVHLYLNGLYWGLYNPTERPESSFAATYFGGDKEDWDALNSGRPLGTSTATTYNTMLNLARQGMESNVNYQKIQGNNPDGTRNPQYVDYLDLDNYIDYMLLNIFVGNKDWPVHNWYAAMNRVESSGWKWFTWDAEWVVGMNSGVTDNITNVNTYLCEPYSRLRANPEFCLRFADRAYNAFFNGGPLYVDPANPRPDPAHPERNRPAALYAELAALVEKAMAAESARWGDAQSAAPYRIDQWRSQRDWVLNTYLSQRSAIVLDQLRSAGLYPTVDAPVFQVNGVPQQGGVVPANGQLTMAAERPATVYYTTDGSDPRQPGFLSGDNKIVTLVPEDAPKRVLVPSVANGGNLLANISAGFDVTFYKAKGTVDSLTAAEAVIANTSLQARTASEKARVINYFNTASLGNFDADRAFPGTTINVDVEDFVVLVTGKVMIPQAGNWTFGVSSDDGFGLTLSKRGKTYTTSYPSPRSPSDTLAVFNIAESGLHDLRLVFYERGGGSELELFAARGSFAAFSATSFRLVGDVFKGGLQVGEDRIWFTNSFDDSSWPLGAGGVGYERGSGYGSLFKIDVGAEMYKINGTCYSRIPFTMPNVTYSNLMLRVRYDDGFIAYLNGAEVARRNFTGAPQWNSVGSADNPDAAAVGQTTIDISDYAGLLGAGANLLAIHGLNGTIDSSDFLISVELVGGELSQGSVAPTAILYAGPIPLKQGTHIKARTFNGKWSALNEAVFSPASVAQSLRISEIMYHPLDTGNSNDPNTEFIELTNIANQSINLNLVRFTEGIDYTFPGFELPAGGYCLVVKDLPAFQAKYGSNLPVVGEYAGSLDNGGEHIELVDAVGQVIQSFTYDDGWFKKTDGSGYSLVIRDPKVSDPNSLNDEEAWRPSTTVGGSPGRGE